MQSNVASANAALDARAASMNGGTPPATLVYRTGAIPANVAAARTGTVISTHNLSNPAGPASANYVFTFSTVSPAVASAGGTPGYYTVHQGGTNQALHQGPAGVGTGEWNFPSAPALGSTVTPTGWIWTDNTQ